MCIAILSLKNSNKNITQGLIINYSKINYYDFIVPNHAKHDLQNTIYEF